jgi:hypothetical protein
VSASPSASSAHLDWIIASEFYDGALAGVGQRSGDQVVVWFRAVAWDDEQWRRVFAVTPVDPKRIADLSGALEKLESRRTPFWFPGPNTTTSVIAEHWRAIAEEAFLSKQWYLVEAHEMIESSIQRLLAPSEVETLVDLLRSGAVRSAGGESLIDDLLIQLDRPPD